MDENISKVYEEIKYLLSDEEILAVAEAREKQFLDYNSAINHATRRGHQEGKIEGIQEGIETGKLAVAKKMLTSFSDEEIVELTELDIDVIKELRREIEWGIIAMDENISKVYEEIKHLLSDEEILAVAEAREKQFLDYNSAINHATRRGHQEGKIEGIQEGIETGKLAIAKKMLTSFSDEEIVELTELDIDVIKEFLHH